MPRAKKIAKKNSKSRPKGFRPPAEVPSLLAALLSVLVVLALISHAPNDGLVATRNYVGAVGVAGSAFLIRHFGLLAFWPAPILFLVSFYIIKPRGRRDGLLAQIVGLLLTLFSLLAIAGLIWPAGQTPLWPEAPGGGAFGAFLAKGLVVALGRIGALLIAPFLALGGLMILTGLTPSKLTKFAGFFKNLIQITDSITPKEDPTIAVKPHFGGTLKRPLGDEENEPGEKASPTPPRPDLVIRENRKKEWQLEFT
jgi:hypothetical protein